MSPFLTLPELQDALATEGTSPRDNGTVEMIVCRPAQGSRQVVASVELSLTEGIVGDSWSTRWTRHTPDGSPHPGMQVSIMNSRVIQAVASQRERWPLAGDNLFVDLDLSPENLPVGQRLAIGSAILEISAIAHNGCQKFTDRFGVEATKFVSAGEGQRWRRRGLFAQVVQAGMIQVGDVVSKLAEV